PGPTSSRIADGGSLISGGKPAEYGVWRVTSLGCELVGCGSGGCTGFGVGDARWGCCSPVRSGPLRGPARRSAPGVRAGARQCRASRLHSPCPDSPPQAIHGLLYAAPPPDAASASACLPPRVLAPQH